MYTNAVLEEGKVSCLEKCPYFRDVFIILLLGRA